MFRPVFLSCAFALACGASFGPIPRDQSRVFNGDVIDISQAPWQVSILENYQDGNIYFICGGTIIGTKYVLTPALFMVGMDVSTLSIYAGSNIYNSGGISYQVAKIQMHPEYVWPDSDIAILTSVNEILTGNLVAPAALPSRDFNIPMDSTGSFTGWGANTVSSIQPSDYLRRVDISVIDSQACGIILDKNITERMFCAGGLSEGPCHGDEGGAFISDGVVLGISGLGRSCQGIGPTIFAKVPYFIDWILNQME